MTFSKTVISFENVTFAYEGATNSALDGVSLDVYAGEFLCILGGNGSGKTTLAKMANGLLVPSEGRVTTCGLDTSDVNNLYRIRQYAGMVFQNPDDQMIGNFIEDEVAFGPENLCLSSTEIQSRVDKSLKEVGLLSFAKQETQALSGGQKQRVAIAGVLAMSPEILVLDEAGSMLDPRGRADLLKACLKLNEAGLTILLITHFLNEAVYADRVVIMEDGKIKQVGCAEAILEDRCLLEELDLDVPYAVGMSCDLRKRGIAIKTCMFDSELAQELRRTGFKYKANRDVELPETCGGAASLEADWGVGSPETNGDTGLPETDGGAGSPEKDGGAGRFQTNSLITSSSPVLPLIEFQGVSHSYLDKKTLKKALKASGRRPASDESNASKWGNPSKCSNDSKWGNEPESIWALKDVSFSIQAGDCLGVIGHTGSGKSTLLKILSGLERPTRGDVLFRGLSLSSKQGKSAVNESIGIVMQYPERQLFGKSVFEDCAFGPRNLGLNEEDVISRVNDALHLVGIDDKSVLKKSPFQLSGGQQRRVAIAGVLAMRPKVLLLDEPTAGLDAKGSQLLLSLIKKMCNEYGATIVIVSHNMDTIAHLCNRILVLNKGLVLEEGSPIEVFKSREKLRGVGLGLPWTLDFAEHLGIKGFNTVPKKEHLTEIIAADIQGASKEASHE